MTWECALKHHSMSHIKEIPILTFNYSNLLKYIDAYNLMNNHYG